MFQGAIYFNDGNIWITVAVPPVAGDAFNGGLRYDSTGKLYTTITVAGSDVYIAGKRVSALGQLVVAATPSLASGNRRYLAGHVFDVTNDALGRQVDQATAATDPFINGLVEGANGGAYMRATGTPP